MRILCCGLAFTICLVLSSEACAEPQKAAKPVWPPNTMLNNNLKCVDLRGLKGRLPLEVASSRQILRGSEKWERSTWSGGGPNVGYPSVVRNDQGPNPDGKYYLYYAHHDPSSGIGCAVAEKIEGPYRKLAELESGRKDSQVLVNPHYPAPKGDPSHYSSPGVVWNGDERLWFMYFHYYNHMWGKTWSKGIGHQLTALATCPDLAKNEWTLWEDASFGTNPPLRPVLPTTKERWMNSQSSYHAVQRLPDGRWLAFLRGTSNAEGDPCKLGFATSTDGRNWDYFKENPVIHQADGGGVRKGVYRPLFIGYLGKGEYLVCWAESKPFDNQPRAIYGRTKDFKTIKRDPRGHARWPVADGIVSPWREGNKLYLFSGKHLHVMILPVASSD